MDLKKIVFFETDVEEKKFLKKRFNKDFQLEFHKEPLGINNYELAKDAAVVSVFIYSKLSEVVLQNLPSLKLIATRSTGFNHINLDAALKRGVSVCNVPYYGENTVAEHTFALILALSRNLHRAYVRSIQGNFSIEGLRGFDLKDKTIGIIGAGSIGTHVIKMAKGFGMNILVFDPVRNHIFEEILEFKYATLDVLLANSDIISLHCPYNENTHYLLNMDNINIVKRGAVFINTARAGLIEPSALYHAIDSGIFSGAGLDVFEGEELASDENQMLSKNVAPEQMEAILKRNILLRRENVIITPHIAFDSVEAVERILETTTLNINSFFRGENYYKVI